MKKLVIAAAAFSALCVPAHANVVIDQSNLATLPSGGTYTLWQAGRDIAVSPGTFVDFKLAQSVTAGLTGKLAAVELQLLPLNTPADFSYTVTLAKNVVFNDDGSVGSALVLGSFDLPRNTLGGWPGGALVNIDTTALGVQLNAGEMFWLGLSAEGEPKGIIGWANGTKTGPTAPQSWLDYSGGAAYVAGIFSGSGDTYKYAPTQIFNGSKDFAFRTWMDVAAVPEPASWAMMIAGFAIVGGTMRRRSVSTLSLG